MRHLDFSAKYSNQTKLSDLKEMILTQLLLSLNRIQLLPIIKKIGNFNLFGHGYIVFGSICCIIGIDSRQNKMIGQFL